MERVPSPENPVLDLRKLTGAAIAKKRAESFDRQATVAWLRLLIKQRPEDRVSLAALEDEADFTMGALWFSERYPECPIALYTTVVPRMTMEEMLRLGPRGKIAQTLGSGMDGDRPRVVLFSSPVDGMPLMAAHTSSKIEVFSYQIVTRMKAAAGDMLIRLQPAEDVAKHLSANCGWDVYA